MASAQCQRTTERSQGHSLGKIQNVSEMAGWVVKEDHHHVMTEKQAQFYAQTQTRYSENGMVAKTQTKCSCQSISSGHRMAKAQTHCGCQTNSNHGHGMAKAQTRCGGQTNGNHDHGMAKAQTHCGGQTNGNQVQGHATNGVAKCNGKTNRRGERKHKSLIQKVKEGISRHCDKESSSSSSESESGDEECGKRKN